jgi:hypothetical protein
VAAVAAIIAGEARPDHALDAVLQQDFDPGRELLAPASLHVPM